MWETSSEVHIGNCCYWPGRVCTYQIFFPCSCQSLEIIPLIAGAAWFLQFRGALYGRCWWHALVGFLEWPVGGHRLQHLLYNWAHGTQCILRQVWIRLASAMMASLNEGNELPEILVLPRCCLNIGQRDGMGCCISNNAVNDLFSCLTCLDVAFSEGKHVSWEVICCKLLSGAVR